MTIARHLIDPDHPDDAETVARMLAESLPGAPAAPDRAAAMRGRLLDRVRASDEAQARLVGSRLGEGEWRPLVRGVRTKILSPAHRAVLLEFEPGAQLPIHRHDEDEECVVLRGEVRMRDLRVSTGDYHLARSASRHGAVRSDGGALLYLSGTPIGDIRGVVKALVGALVPGSGEPPRTLRAGEGTWTRLAPGVDMRALHRHGDRESSMLRFAPGASLPSHALDADAESLVVEGELYYGRDVAGPGDYRIAQAGHAAPELASDAGATVFLRGARPGRQR
jgi:quercetin dioxygenase-like cupin family protein